MRYRPEKNLAVTSRPINQIRPHQALFNFTPAHVHQLNNKSRAVGATQRYEKKDPRETKSLLGGKTKYQPSPNRGGMSR